MRVRFGFVAMSLELENASPAKAMTVTNFLKISDREAALRRITRIANDNLENTLRILQHAHASGVHVYRLSSKIIPLYGHELTCEWDFFRYLGNSFAEIGEFVRSHDMRVSFHPDHFTLLNSPKPEVLANSLANLAYHGAMFDTMGLDNRAKNVIHVGGGYKDKAASLLRFRENYAEIPRAIKERLTLENDDKTYTARDTLRLCQAVDVPMVLDIHHHRCNHEPDGDLKDILYDVLQTWNGTGLAPKIHASSSKSEKEFRAHHDEVFPGDVVPFLELCKVHNQDIDIMLEAKNKDLALFQLLKELAKVPSVKVLDGSTIQYGN